MNATRPDTMSDTDDQADDLEDDDAMIWEDLQSDSDGEGSDNLDRDSSSSMWKLEAIQIY
jgi:hypothetical protein